MFLHYIFFASPSKTKSSFLVYRHVHCIVNCSVLIISPFILYVYVSNIGYIWLQMFIILCISRDFDQAINYCTCVPQLI